MCNCVSLTNAALAEHNTELGTVTIMSEQRWSRRIGITTDIVEKKRGAKPVRIVATFCPLCGGPYEAASSSAATAEAEPRAGQPPQTEGVS